MDKPKKWIIHLMSGPVFTVSDIEPCSDIESIFWYLGVNNNNVVDSVERIYD